jgi:RimJ/RimL family protein N-acetyltransferase
MCAMPSLTRPAIPAGRLAASGQPLLSIEPGLALRPWTAADAPAVIAAYTDPDIRYWHARTVDSEAEARALIERWRSAWAAESGANWAVVRTAAAVPGEGAAVTSGWSVDEFGSGAGGRASDGIRAGTGGHTSDGMRGGTSDRAGGGTSDPAGDGGSGVQYGDLVLGRVALRAIDTEQGRAECAYWIRPEARGGGVATRALSALSTWAFDEAGFHRLFLVHSTANEPSCRVATRAGFAPEGVERSSVLHSDGWHDMHVHSRINGLE